MNEIEKEFGEIFMEIYLNANDYETLYSIPSISPKGLAGSSAR